jgi:predicted methyltransferase
MKTVLPRPTELARTWIQQALREGDIAIDATVGNGHDTLFLVGCVGATGRVIGFDIQQAAIESARNLLRENRSTLSNVDFHCMSHAKMTDVVTTLVRAVMFNLGYLPGADHSLITSVAETIPALQAASSQLAAGGLITVVCYPGHPGGEEEMRAVIDWASHLDSGWQVAKYEKIGTRKSAPVLLGIHKTGGGV